MRPNTLRMWQAAEELVDRSRPVAQRGSHSARHAADHLERSAESALFTIAEGAGAFQPRVKISCYEIVRMELPPPPAAQAVQQCDETTRPIFKSTSGAT